MFGREQGGMEGEPAESQTGMEFSDQHSDSKKKQHKLLHYYKPNG